MTTNKLRPQSGLGTNAETGSPSDGMKYSAENETQSEDTKNQERPEGDVLFDRWIEHTADNFEEDIKEI